MTHTIIVENLRKIKKAVPLVESRLKVKIKFGKGGQIFILGEEFNAFLVDKILRAVDFGFDIEDAMLLRDDNFILEFVNMKEHTRRKNLEDVRARMIGTDGKAKRTIEELSGCVIAISGNQVGVIVNADHLDSVIQAIISLVQGAKHGNVFAYLEKQNAVRRSLDKDDLGLKIDDSEFEGV